MAKQVPSHILVILVFVSTVMFAGGHSEGSPKSVPIGAKLSAHLRILVSGRSDDVEFAKRHLHIKAAPKTHEPLVDVFVEFQGEANAFRTLLGSYGARVRTIAGNVATVDLPMRAVRPLAEDPTIIRIEEDTSVDFKDVQIATGVPATGVNGASAAAENGAPPRSPGAVWGSPVRPLLRQQWTGNTGKHVVVGVVDTGIDLNHLDFRDSSGNTRIVSLWDQTKPGTPPKFFTFGNECTRDSTKTQLQQIDAVSQNVDLAIGVHDYIFQGMAMFVDDGIGNLNLTTTFPFGFDYRSPFAVADFNLDGKPDILAVGLSSDNTTRYYSVLPGNGNGTLGNPSSSAPLGTDVILSVVPGDFNQDGIPDFAALAVGTASSAGGATVAILLGNGDGTFGQPTCPISHPTCSTYDIQNTSGKPESSFPIAIADVNGDGIPDLIVANGSEDSVTILLGNGDGTFRPVSGAASLGLPTFTVPGTGVLTSIAAGDFDGDGIPDLAISAYPNLGGPAAISILLGQGNGTFALHSQIGGPAYFVALGDFNGDGNVDLVSSYGVGVSVLLGDGQGNFTPPIDYDTGAFSSASIGGKGLLVTDLNGDGKLDIVRMGGDGFGDVFPDVLLGNGDGTFQPAYFTGASFVTPDPIALGNFHSLVCTEIDVVGHGTHVAGIAAGNGSATNYPAVNSTAATNPAYRYIGMAPEADLVVVKLLSLTTVIDAIAYIEQVAADLNEPVVINLSLGGSDPSDPRDGSSNYEKSLDFLSGPSKILVFAAGNDGAQEMHASGVITDGSTQDVHFNVPPATTNKFELGVWYPGSDQIGVGITGPGCTNVPAGSFIYPGEPPADVVCNGVNVGRITSMLDATNGDIGVDISMDGTDDPSTTPLPSGDWFLSLAGVGCSTAPCVHVGTFDIWSKPTPSNPAIPCGLAPNENDCFFFTTFADPNKTLDLDATSTNVVSVASYKSNASWTGLGNQQINAATGNDTGSISIFSSRGPRRTCSNLLEPCSIPVQKPDIAAPGEMILSSYAAATGAKVCGVSAPGSCLEPDGQHIASAGTSQAAPHVTGAVALLLAQNPNMTPDEVKLALRNARMDSFTSVDASGIPVGSLPNNVWGYGKLAVDLAFNPVNTVTVPSVIGLTQVAAYTTLQAANLTIGNVTHRSDPAPVGTVIFQNPGAGSLANAGTSVNVVLSGTLVPNLVGTTLDQAKTAISSVNLTVGNVTGQVNPTIPAGAIIRQNPPAGDYASQAAPVDLVVSGVQVPAVTGLAQPNAQFAITNATLAIGNISYQGSTTVPIDQVLAQNPVGGSFVAPGSAVDLVLSGIVVPNVVGFTQTAAQAVITAANLSVGSVSILSSKNPVGTIVSETPTAGSIVAQGATVDLVISGTVVPNVVGSPQAAAQVAITAANLSVGAISITSSLVIPVGNVISENPAAGSVLDQGASVDLVISSGPPLIPVPNVIGLTRVVATNTIQGVGLTVGIVNLAASDTVSPGNVISQAPVTGTLVEPASSVNLTISSGPTCASNVTSSISITNSGFSYSVVTKRYSRTVTLTNSGANPVSGPIYFVVDDLSSNATLSNAASATSCAAPLGTPYVAASRPLAPGGSANILLQFTDPNMTAITYTPRVLAGSGMP